MSRNFRNETVYFDDFPQFFSGLLQRYADRPAVSQYDRKGEEHRYTYEQLIGDGFAVAEVIAGQGIYKEHIAIVGENSYQWLVAFIGIVCSGNVAVCVDTEQPDDTIVEMIRHADATSVFCSPTFVDLVGGLKEDASVERAALLTGKEEFWLTLDELIERGKKLIRAGQSKCSEVAIEKKDTAMIVYTSGTTNNSKPVMLSHIGVVTNISDSLAHCKAGKTVFTSLPFYHAYGLVTCVWVNMLNGAHMYVNGNLKMMLRDMRAAQAESLCSVPLIMETIYRRVWEAIEEAGKKEQVEKLIRLNLFLKKFGLSFQTGKLKAAKEKFFGPLHIVSCGGAHISKKICEELDLFGIRIIQGYGITECSPVISINCNKSFKMGSVGHVLPHFDLKLVDGEIWVKGVSVMNGYYKNEALTAECIEDGWYKTGDIGEMDSQGFLHITGRKKDLIVFKNGKKISPELVEKEIYQIPFVKEAVVYGTANSETPDDVKLAVCIYPDEEKTVGMESYEILEHLNREIDQMNEKLPFYQKIQMVSIRETAFEKTSSGKIKRDRIGGI